MESMTFFDYSTGEVIDVGKKTVDYNGCYFDRKVMVDINSNNQQNAEWYIQQRIMDNEAGYFDFSKNMIDVGSYVGIYRWNLPFRKAWLFEPNKESYMYCCANAVLHNRVWDTFIYNEILSNKHEIIKFNGYEGIDAEMRGVTDIPGNFAYLESNVDMEARTLDDHIDEFDNIGFIKIDCEGMDWKVMDGGRKTIEKFNYPPILFENWPERDHQNYPSWLNESEIREKERNENIRKVLGELGYEILWNWGDAETHLAVHKS